MDQGERALKLLAFTLGAWVLLAAVGTWLMARTLPRGHRVKAVPTGFLHAMFGPFSRARWTLSRDARAAIAPRVVGHVVAWSELERRDDLVADRQCITTEGSEAEVLALDLDGTVLVSQRLPHDNGYHLYLRHRDGSLTDVVRDGVHDTGWSTGGSLNRGAATWMRWDPIGRVLELWRWDAPVGARVLHSVDVPRKGSRAAPTGWTVVSGEVVVATFLDAMVGRVIAHDPVHGAVEIALTAWPTLHRDLGAEARGRRLAAFNIHRGGPVPNRVATVDFDVWPPVVSELGGGFAAGASTVHGQILGFWAKPPILEIPVDQGLRIDNGTVWDPVGDDDWVAFTLAQPVGVIARQVNMEAVLIDGTRTQVLTDHTRSQVLLRGGFVCWQETTPRPVPDPGTPQPGTTSWVARLVPHVEPAQDPGDDSEAGTGTAKQLR